MLVTHDFGGEQSSEVIDLRNPDNVCASFADAGPRQFPYGALLQKSLPVVCGGYSNQDCVVIGRDTSTPLVDLTFPRPESASVLIDDSTLWITGAEWGEGLGNSEFVTIESDGSAQSILGPDLPMQVFGHCMAKIDDNTYFLSGGYRLDTDSIATKATFFYDMTSETWTRGPDMIERRAHHSCEVFMNPATNNLNIVLMGGYDYETQTTLEQTELLDLDGGAHGWTYGPRVPQAVRNPASVSLGKSVVLIGGLLGSELSSSDQLNELVCDADSWCSWVTLEQTLKHPRWGHVAMLIPDDLAGC